MPVKKVKGKWCVDVWIRTPDGDHQRIRRRSPFPTRTETEELERQLIEDISSTWTQPEERRYSDHAVEFLKTYAVANNKYSEVVTKESILRVHLLPAFGHFMLHEIGAKAIERYKAGKLEQGLKPKTINNHLAVLRKSLAVAAEWGLITNAPRVKQMKTAKPSFDFLNHEEADRLVAASDGVFRAMIITALKTGLRLGELRALRWEDVDLVACQLMVRQSVCRGKVGTPKSNRERVLPLCDTAVAALRAERHLRGELVLCADDGRMLSKAETYSGLQRACRRAGLRKIGWHCCRHTFASHLVMAGVPLKAVQELLGHATIEMTLRYSHLSPEARRQAVCMLDRPTAALPWAPQPAQAPGALGGAGIGGGGPGGNGGSAGWDAGRASGSLGAEPHVHGAALPAQVAGDASAVSGGGPSKAERPALRLAESPQARRKVLPAGGSGD